MPRISVKLRGSPGPPAEHFKTLSQRSEDRPGRVRFWFGTDLVMGGAQVKAAKSKNMQNLGSTNPITLIAVEKLIGKGTMLGELFSKVCVSAQLLDRKLGE